MEPSRSGPVQTVSRNKRQQLPDWQQNTRWANWRKSSTSSFALYFSLVSCYKTAASWDTVYQRGTLNGHGWQPLFTHYTMLHTMHLRLGRSSYPIHIIWQNPHPQINRHRSSPACIWNKCYIFLSLSQQAKLASVEPLNHANISNLHGIYSHPSMCYCSFSGKHCAQDGLIQLCLCFRSWPQVVKGKPLHLAEFMDGVIPSGANRGGWW